MDFRQMILLTEQHMLLEGRIDFLKQKYTPLLEPLLAKINSGKIMAPAIEGALPGHYTAEHIFDYVVACDPSPTKIYSQWVLNLLVAGKLLPEDIFMTTDDLTAFTKAKPHMPTEQRDINKYSSLSTLYSTIEPYLTAVSNSEKDRQLAQQMSKESRVCFDDAEIKIVSPLTWEAAKFFGRNTRWCTSMENDDRYFKQYTEKGPLYIIIDKASGERWQFQLDTKSYMDAADRSIDLAAFLKRFPKVDQYFAQADIKNSQVIARLPDSQYDLCRPLDGPNQLVIKAAFGISPIAANKGYINWKDDKTIDRVIIQNITPNDLNIVLKIMNDMGIHGYSDVFFNNHNIVWDKKLGYCPMEKAMKLLMKSGDYDWKSFDIETNTHDGSKKIRCLELFKPSLFGDEPVGVEINLTTMDKNSNYGYIDADNRRVDVSRPPTAETAQAYFDLLMKIPIKYSFKNTTDPASTFKELGRDDLAKAIIVQRPQFTTLLSDFSVNGDTPKLRKRILAFIEENHSPTTPHGVPVGKYFGDRLTLEAWKDSADAADSFGNDEVKWLAGDDHDFDSYDGDFDKADFCDDLLRKCKPDEVKFFWEEVDRAYAEAWPSGHEDDEYELEENPDFEPDRDEKLKRLIDEQDWMIDEINQAHRYSEESGYQSSIHDDLKSVFASEKDLFFYKDGKLSHDFFYDAPVVLAPTIEEIVPVLTEDHMYSFNSWPELFDVELKASDRDDHNGFDIEAGVESFRDYLRYMMREENKSTSEKPSE